LINRNDPEIGKRILQELTGLAEKAACELGRPPVLMEICGTHTVAISRSGIRSLLKDFLVLKSGPGCPVCVTDQSDIDRIILLSRQPGVVIATFGDMLRVPGTDSSLEQERARQAKVEIFYSPLEAVDFAEKYPGEQVVFLGIGFETTTPAIALSIRQARKQGLPNYSVFSVHKVVPPVMSVLLNDPELGVDGFILPGHVCTITGRKAFDFISADYNKPAVIAGFESVDVLEAICLLLKQIIQRQARTVNGYARLVQEEGNKKAREIMNQVFSPADVCWRGFGIVEGSGLKINQDYVDYDASLRFPVETDAVSPQSNFGCACGDVLKGKINPGDCPLFAKRCTPLWPVGPCMVSSEGACAAYYQYELS